MFRVVYLLVSAVVLRGATVDPEMVVVTHCLRVCPWAIDITDPQEEHHGG